MKVLEKLYEKRIVGFEIIDNQYAIAFEACDEYYNCKLSKDELLQLSDEIKELANSLKGDWIDW